MLFAVAEAQRRHCRLPAYCSAGPGRLPCGLCGKCLHKDLEIAVHSPTASLDHWDPLHVRALVAAKKVTLFDVFPFAAARLSARLQEAVRAELPFAPMLPLDRIFRPSLVYFPDFLRDDIVRSLTARADFMTEEDEAAVRAYKMCEESKT